MSGLLRRIFKKCVRRSHVTLPMLTLAAMLSAPVSGMAAPGKLTKTSTTRSAAAKVTDKATLARKEPKKEAKKEPRTAHGKAVAKADETPAKGKAVASRGASLKKSVKTLAGGRRVAPSKNKNVQRAAVNPVAYRPVNEEEGGLFSQLKEMEDPNTRQRLAKSNPMFRPPPTPSNSLKEIISGQAASHGLNPLLIQAVVAVESGFNPMARSPQGALGMMQLTPATANRLGVSRPMDAEDNIRGGTLYLKMLTEQFDGDTTLALAAYHAGPKTVEEYGGVPPSENTHLFLKRVMLYFNYYLDQE